MPELGEKGSLKSLDFEIILFYGWICFTGLISVAKFNNFKQFAYIMSSLSMKLISKGADIRIIDGEVTKFFS